MELALPYTMIISGQTGSGKTHFVKNLLENLDKIHSDDVTKVILAFTMIQDTYIALKKQMGSMLDLEEGFPSDKINQLIESPTEKGHTLVILDDLMIELENDKRLTVLFTKMRHKNVSTIFLVQNFYFKGKHMTTITRNAHYLVLFENPRDTSLVSTLGRQVFPTNPKFLPDAFRQATQKAYGYLFLDFKPGSDKKLMVREGIFPTEQTFVYLPK